MKHSKTTGALKAVALVVGLVAVVAILAMLVFLALTQRGTQTACTEEAKLCPDGSSVGHTGPKCEFSACPVASVPDSWKVFSGSGYSFRYPETLPAQYVSFVDWPPKVQMIDHLYRCAEAGDEADRAGVAVRQVMNGREYCVTKVTEGAAGSIFTEYVYSFSYGRKTAILTFSTRATQCGNYGNEEKAACENERAALNMDGIVDLVARTLQ